MTTITITTVLIIALFLGTLGKALGVFPVPWGIIFLPLWLWLVLFLDVVIDILIDAAQPAIQYLKRHLE